MKNIKVYYGGALYYKNIIYQLLKNSINIIEVNKIEDADLVYWVYGRGPSLSIKNSRFWITSKQKFILHWIGTDVLTHITKLKSRKLKSIIYHNFWNFLIKRKISKNRMLNLCCATWLCDELELAGISSFYIPLTTISNNIEQFVEIERNYDFLSYLPQKRMDLYNGQVIFNIAEELSDKKFLIIIPDIEDKKDITIPDKLENVTLLPKVDIEKMKEIYRNSKCLLRFTKHDGLSLSVLEALSNRMHISWTYSFPYVNKANIENKEELVQSLKRIIQGWKPNFDGQSFILSELNISVISLRFSKLFKNFFLT